MPTYEKTVLTAQARQLGFLTAPFEKMTRLTEILRFINEADKLRETLALKGGTAINLTMFNLPRLSVDIDLDFTKNLPKEDTKIKREEIGKLLSLYMTAEGYKKHGRSKSTHILDSFVYSYTNVAGNSDNIKVEINYSLRSHVLPVVEMIARVSEVFIPIPVRILAPIEIFASKIVALSDRAAARDLYDLNNMIYYNLFNEHDLGLLLSPSWPLKNLSICAYIHSCWALLPNLLSFLFFLCNWMPIRFMAWAFLNNFFFHYAI